MLFADERYVPLTDADSNYLACRALFDKVPIPDGQILALDYSTGSLQVCQRDVRGSRSRWGLCRTCKLGSCQRALLPACEQWLRVEACNGGSFQDPLSTVYDRVLKTMVPF